MSELKHESAGKLNRLMLASGMIVAAMSIISAYAWLELPTDTQIPVHWGFNGQPDRYNDKIPGLLYLPAVTLAVGLLFRLFPLIEPRRNNLLRSWTAYRNVCLAVCLLMFGLHAAHIGNLLGLVAFDTLNVVGVLFAVVLIVSGNYLGKVRSNFMFGIRTPWTLTSDLSWNKTHRLGGRLFVLAGCVGLLGQVISFANPVSVLISVLIPIVLFLFAYSYLVWRDDPHKQNSH